ncbi:DinB family protein [Marinomonas agarivorans]|nr:DinB family protein [Marinomonas agarivorans]
MSGNSIIQGNLETLRQAKDVIHLMSNDIYCHTQAPHMQSSIGQHIRHLIDNYLALQQGTEIGHVDYNWRRRGAEVETNKDIALLELEQLINWLSRLSDTALTQNLTLLSEVCLSETQSDFATSTLHRELIFVASHSIHHLAIIGIGMRLQNLTVPDHVGLAPATASFLRQQTEKKTA